MRRGGVVMRGPSCLGCEGWWAREAGAEEAKAGHGVRSPRLRWLGDLVQLCGGLRARWCKVGLRCAQRLCVGDLGWKRVRGS